MFNTKNNLSVKIEKKLLEIIKRDENIRLEFQKFLSQNDFYSTPDEFQNAVAELKEKESKTLRIIILLGVSIVMRSLIIDASLIKHQIY